MNSLSLSDQHKFNELNKELTVLVKYIADLENENRAAMEKFHNGYYNQRANFNEAKEVIEVMKERRKEIKKAEKNCFKIREKLKHFS